MIVVLGRPAAAIVDGRVVPVGLAAGVALAAAAEGAPVELVGTIGDDDLGDRLAVALDQSGVGHAALLRIAGAATPVPRGTAQPPRLDAGDVDLGLRYLPSIRVLIAAEPLAAGVAAIVAEAAAYHGAALIAVVPAGKEPPAPLADDATVLVAPDGDVQPFARLVARYAVELRDGTPPTDAFDRAVAATGWERHA